jgi:uncharacterized membrane protein
MSFSLYIGFVVGILIGLVLAGVGMSTARKKRGVVEQDERTELISARGGRTALLGVSVVAFVAWVVENIVRHLDGLDVHFFSPWAIMLLTIFVLYVVACYYESRKVSDPDAEPDEHEKKRLEVSLGGLVGSLCIVTAVLVSAGNRMDSGFLWFLIAFELVMLATVGIIFAKTVWHKHTRA